LQIFGILLVVGGIMVAAGLVSLARQTKFTRKGPLLAVLVALVWGLGYPLLDRSVFLIGWQTTLVVQALLMIPVTLCLAAAATFGFCAVAPEGSGGTPHLPRSRRRPTSDDCRSTRRAWAGA
jgi:hypothetical protein